MFNAMRWLQVYSDDCPRRPGRAQATNSLDGGGGSPTACSTSGDSKRELVPDSCAVFIHDLLGLI